MAIPWALSAERWSYAAEASAAEASAAEREWVWVTRSELQACGEALSRAHKSALYFQRLATAAAEHYEAEAREWQQRMAEWDKR